MVIDFVTKIFAVIGIICIVVVFLFGIYWCLTNLDVIYTFLGLI